MLETESDSLYRHLDKMSPLEILENINKEDAKVHKAVYETLPALEKLVKVVSARLIDGGRLFYIGAGTSGRLGIVDASECPPTFGVEQGKVIGIIAGGDSAIRQAVEHAEDSTTQGWDDLQKYNITKNDVVIGIAASGKTPYVVSAVKACRENGIDTGCIVCTTNSPLAQNVDYPVEVVVGPEFITGSTRMKSGTAQKMVLNMISTASMIALGRVEDNRMVNMQLSNDKLIERGTHMVTRETGLEPEAARELLLKHGSVKKAILAHKL